MLEACLLWLTHRLTGVLADGLDRRPRQRIYCANHCSHLDALLLLAALPPELRRDTRPVAAADYWAKGRMRNFVTKRVFRALLIDRLSQGLNPLCEVFGTLRRGGSIIYFPEGKRGPGGGLQPLKAGIYFLARAFPQVDIVPVRIEGTDRILPKGARLPRPARCLLRFGQPLRWKGEEETAFLRQLRLAMEEPA